MDRDRSPDGKQTTMSNSSTAMDMVERPPSSWATSSPAPLELGADLLDDVGPDVLELADAAVVTAVASGRIGFPVAVAHDRIHRTSPEAGADRSRDRRRGRCRHVILCSNSTATRTPTSEPVADTAAAGADPLRRRGRRKWLQNRVLIDAAECIIGMYVVDAETTMHRTRSIREPTTFDGVPAGTTTMMSPTIDLTQQFDKLENSLPMLPAQSVALGRASVRRTNDVMTSVVADVTRRIGRVVTTGPNRCGHDHRTGSIRRRSYDRPGAGGRARSQSARHVPRAAEQQTPQSRRPATSSTR